jgi:hypothetical protein
MLPTCSTQWTWVKRFRIVDCGMWISDCGLWISECGLWISECGLRISECGFRISECVENQYIPKSEIHIPKSSSINNRAQRLLPLSSIC